MATITVGAQRRCCGQAEFDTTFPQSLDAFMTREEFNASINRINKAYKAGCSRIVKFVVGLIPLIGLVLSIAGIVSAKHRHDRDHHGRRGGKKQFRMIMIGNIMIIAGLLSWILVLIYFNIKKRRVTRVQCQYETAIYQQRARPTSWRFNDANRSQHQILIDCSSLALASISTADGEGINNIRVQPAAVIASAPSAVVQMPVAAPIVMPTPQPVSVAPHHPYISPSVYPGNAFSINSSPAATAYPHLNRSVVTVPQPNSIQFAHVPRAGDQYSYQRLPN